MPEWRGDLGSLFRLTKLGGCGTNLVGGTKLRMFDFFLWAGELYLYAMLTGGIVLAALVAHDHIVGQQG